MIVIVTGMPGSGKSKIVKEFEKRGGFPSVSLGGDIVREETLKRGLELTKENVAKVSIRLRQELGQNAVAKLAVEKVKALLKGSKVVVIDGVRSLMRSEPLGGGFSGRENYYSCSPHTTETALREAQGEGGQTRRPSDLGGL